MSEDRNVALHENVQYNQRQKVRQIEAQPFGEGHAVTGVRFFDEIIPAPAVTTGTEGKVKG